MTPQPFPAKNAPFRSRQEREREADLLRNYRQIGIAAIAAAAAAKHAVAPQRKVPGLATRRAANLNGTL